MFSKQTESCELRTVGVPRAAVTCVTYDVYLSVIGIVAWLGFVLPELKPYMCFVTLLNEVTL